MSLHRVVCLSHPHPIVSVHDVLTVCHEYPERNAQSGVCGRVLCIGEQFVFLLEGERDAVEGLVERIQLEAPDAGLAVQARYPSEQRAFSSWAIEDLYLDELAHHDPVAAEELGDLVIDLFSGVSNEDQDTFAAIADLVKRSATTPNLARAAAA